MRSIRLPKIRQAATVVAVAAIVVVAGCGGSNDSKDAAGVTTTTGGAARTTSTVKAPGDGEVDARFCAALSADLDAIDAIEKSFEGGGSASGALVQDGQHANEALRAATPDGLSAEARAIYEPLGKLLDELQSGKTASIGADYAAAVGSPDFSGPLGTLARRCAALATAG
jgi:hypothetical protein